MKIVYIGADHAGFALKEKIKKWLMSQKVLVEDLGNLKLDKKDDYPDYAVAVARKVKVKNGKGILCCGSSQGVCVTANKVKGVRAVAPTTMKETQLAREHLDANVICLSGWNTSERLAKKMVGRFLQTSFSGEERHVRRINKIAKVERGL
jgi:ribose 5-phosphate isomerase B